MTPRTEHLRALSLETEPSISEERAVLLTEFYAREFGRHPVTVLRGLAFEHLCAHKTLYLGEGELIVGERGPRPKAVPTYPEITCHSLEDLTILNSRPKTWYRVDQACLDAYRDVVIPFWSARSLRERMFELLDAEWHEAYDAGVFTEFMEQRAPGHTVLDDKIYHRGLLDFRADAEAHLARLDFANDPKAASKRDTLKGFLHAIDGTLRFAERHAELAEAHAALCSAPDRRAELLKVAEVCRRVPAHAPRDFHEALQSYWFCHLGVITELNGWDAFCPGHLDQHLGPFYAQGLADGTLTRGRAKELLECFFVKFNNHRRRWA